MPRFPTIRVIGSQDMSTTLPASGLTLSLTAIPRSPLSVPKSVPACLERPALLAAPPRPVAGGELVAVVAPLGLLVDRLVGDPAQLADHRPIGSDDGRGDPAARRHVHERHELVGEP